MLHTNFLICSRPSIHDAHPRSRPRIQLILNRNRSQTQRNNSNNAKKVTTITAYRPPIHSQSTDVHTFAAVEALNKFRKFSTAHNYPVSLQSTALWWCTTRHMPHAARHIPYATCNMTHISDVCKCLMPRAPCPVPRAVNCRFCQTRGGRQAKTTPNE